MKKLSVLLLAVFAVFCSINAQTQEKNAPKSERKMQKNQAMSADEKSDKMLARLTKQLNLNESQQKQAKEIFLTSESQLKALKGNMDEDKKAKHEQRKAILQKADASFLAILNADQAKKYNEMKAERKEKREEKKKMHKNK